MPAAAQETDADHKVNQAEPIGAKKDVSLTATTETTFTQQVTFQSGWKASRTTSPTRSGT